MPSGKHLRNTARDARPEEEVAMPFERSDAQFEPLLALAGEHPEIEPQLRKLDDERIRKLLEDVRAQKPLIWDSARAEIDRVDALETKLADDEARAASLEAAPSPWFTFLRGYATGFL